jgi:hypothetical protein
MTTLTSTSVVGSLEGAAFMTMRSTTADERRTARQAS